jgi:RNA polymerase sigma-70 factor (ECF subfamily)
MDRAGYLPDTLIALVTQAQCGQIDAFGRLVGATQGMTYGVAFSVLHDVSLAQDATQEAYLRAFRRIGELQEPGGFIVWLRRIVITVALNMRRARRLTLLRLEDVEEVPVLDEAETVWSERQRHRLSTALLSLSGEERRLCDRRYHGRWTMAQLANAAGVDESTMRKRLQRVRDKLRKEIEVAEQREVGPRHIPEDLPAKIVELLAHPRLTDIPTNPVGSVLSQLRAVYADFVEREVPEVIDFSEARTTIGDVALYIDPSELHRVDDRRVLRYDLTLPLLMSTKYTGEPLRVWTSGKAYRRGPVDAKHLEAFHQAEAFRLDEHRRLDQWALTSTVLQSVDRVLPGRTLKIVPTRYPMCKQAWELEVEDDGQWLEILAWGVFTDEIVAHVGGDPSCHTAIGVGYGLERLAMVRYRIDDIRKIDVTNAA